MNTTQNHSRSTSPENFQRLYDELSESDKALINAYMSMTFSFLRSIQELKDKAEQKGDPT